MNTSNFTSNSFIRKIIQESSWVFIGQIGAIIAQLALIKTTTTLIPVSEYGTFSLLLIYALLIERTLMSVQAGITRYYCEAHELGQLDSFWIASKSLLIRPTQATAVIGALVAFMFLVFGNYYFFISALIITPFTIFMGWNTALAGIQLAARNRKVHSLAQLSEPMFRLICLVALVFLFEPSAQAILLAYLIASIVNCIFLYSSTKALLQSKYPNTQITSKILPFHASVASWSTKIWTYSWPFALWGILTWVQQSSDRFSLEYTSGSESVGYYSVLFQIGFMPMILLSSMTSNLITPIVFKQYSLRTNSRRKVTGLFGKDNLLAVSIVLISCVTILFAISAAKWHEQILQLLVSPDYLKYSNLLYLMILAGGLTSIGQFLSTKIMAQKSTKKLLIGNVIYAILATSANILGSINYGIYGVVSAVIFSSFVYVLIFYFLSRRINLTPSPGRL